MKSSQNILPQTPEILQKSKFDPIIELRWCIETSRYNLLSFQAKIDKFDSVREEVNRAFSY